MPRKYADQTKRKAVGMLQIHDDISLAHYTTGVHRRTLRRWRDELRGKQNGYMSEKVSASDTKKTDKADAPGSSPVIDRFQRASIDYEDFSFVRQQLMQYARRMAVDLRPDESDSNRRTLALSRILDRIERLDRILPKIAKKQKRPIWQDAYDDLVSLNLEPDDMIRIEESVQFLDDRIKARRYTNVVEWHRKSAKKSK